MDAAATPTRGAKSRQHRARRRHYLHNFDHTAAPRLFHKVSLAARVASVRNICGCGTLSPPSLPLREERGGEREDGGQEGDYPGLGWPRDGR